MPTLPLARARAFRFAATVLVALLVGACGAHRSQPDDAYTTERAEEVFARAYESVFDRYLFPLNVDEVAFDGIAGLSELDGGIRATRDGDSIRLAFAGTELMRQPLPRGGKVEDWAHLTVLAIDAARTRSALMGAAGTEDIYKAVLNAALAKLDRHSRYAGLRSARDYRAQREGFGGIGVRLNFDHELPQIIAVLPDGPARDSAIRPGDVINEINGEPLDGLGRREIVWRLRGDVDSEVTLTLTRKAEPQPFAVSLRRGLIVSPTVHVRRAGGIGIVGLTGFNQRTARNLTRTLNDLAAGDGPPLTGLVLDMRGNPGGLLDQAVAVADAFLDHGRVVSTRGRHPDSFQLFNAGGRDIAKGLPLVVLINGQSASAAEIVAAALQDHGRAVVVGSNSYGKGSVQSITRLPNDGELILTWARFHAPSGYALENLGVMPNFCTSVPAPGAPAAGSMQMAVETSIVLTAWRSHSGYDKESAEGMRARCPRRSEAPESDIDVARNVLADGPLYARAVAASRPNLARSSREAAPPGH